MARRSFFGTRARHAAASRVPSLLVLGLIALLAAGCGGGGDSGEDALAELAGEAAGDPDAGTDAGGAQAPRTATLEVEGDPLSAPGEYELRTSCSYSRGQGAFSFGMHPEVDSQVEQGAATFGVRAGALPGTSIPMEDGRYEAEWEYTKVTGEGPVLTYTGEGEMSIRIVDDSRENFLVVEVDASGSGEGMRFQARGGCQAMVMG